MKQIPLIKVAVACVWLLGVAVPVVASPVPVHHDLEVTLYPQDQRLTGVDTLKLETPAGDEVLLMLADDARITGVSIGKKTAVYTFKDGHLRIPVPDNLREEEIKVAVSYYRLRGPFFWQGLTGIRIFPAAGPPFAYA
jgi:hypothetical protein